MNIDKQALLNRVDKAKETMEELGELFLSTHTRPIKYTTGHSAICEILNDVKTELSNPTLDDAIEVVEEMIENNEIKLSEHAGGVSRMLDLKYANANYRDVLTALKGLKEGKEKC